MNPQSAPAPSRAEQFGHAIVAGLPQPGDAQSFTDASAFAGSSFAGDSFAAVSSSTVASVSAPSAKLAMEGPRLRVGLSVSEPDEDGHKLLGDSR